jgi:hypothetical protein
MATADFTTTIMVDQTLSEMFMVSIMLRMVPSQRLGNKK